MKQTTIFLATAISLVMLAGAACAHMYGGPGMWGGGYGPGMSPGMMYGGCGMMGPGMWGGGYGPGMMWGYGEEGQKFLDETLAMRKEMHDKMFEYMEAWRKGDEKKADALGKELWDLRQKLHSKARDMGLYKKFPRGYGHGPGMMGPMMYPYWHEEEEEGESETGPGMMH